MTRKFVRVSSELHASLGKAGMMYEKEEDLSTYYLPENLPVYRLYINNELLTERTWRWDNSFLVEELQIDAEPGHYTLKYELIDQGDLTEFVLNVGTLTATLGDVEVLSKEQFVIKS